MGCGLPHFAPDTQRGLARGSHPIRIALRSLPAGTTPTMAGAVRTGSCGWGRDPGSGTLVRAKDGGVETRQVPSIPGNYLAYYQAIRDAITLGAPNPVPPEEGLAVIKVLEAGIRSAAARAEVPYNHAESRSSAI